MENRITVEAVVNAPLEDVWALFNDIERVSEWAFASNDWRAEGLENDLIVGGKLRYRMEANDGSAGFEFVGTYTEVEERERVAYDLEDGRQVVVVFEETPGGVRMTQTFDAEEETSKEMQRQGWQAILDNFKQFAEQNA